ncbi:hypothetical protein D3C72_2241940 [compost metagenome]
MAASTSEYGRMMYSVSSVSGTCGRWNCGRPPAMEPMSPTVLVSMPKPATTPATIRIAASAAGMARLRRGSR